MKRKPNSVRACRALRKENRALIDRLRYATKLAQRSWLVSYAMPGGMEAYLRSAARLGFTVEVTEAGNGDLRLEALKRTDA